MEQNRKECCGCCWPEGNEVGNGRRNWISSASFVATKDGRTVRNNYSRILQTLNNRNSYLIIGEYTLLCFFMHYVWMKVSLVLVIGFNFVKDLDLENCFYFFVIIVSFK